MITITSRTDYNDLEGRARSLAERHLDTSDLTEAALVSLEIDEAMSCEMAVSYHFSYSFESNGKTHQSHGYVTFFANGTHVVQLEPGEFDAPSGEDEWHVVYGDYGDALIYTLREDGYRRGEPILVNDVMIRIEPANRSKTDISPVVDKVLTALQ